MLCTELCRAERPAGHRAAAAHPFIGTLRGAKASGATGIKIHSDLAPALVRKIAAAAGHWAIALAKVAHEMRIPMTVSTDGVSIIEEMEVLVDPSDSRRSRR